MEPPLSTIAVVDDDTDLRESLVWLLSSVGLTAQPFASGNAFLAAQRDHIAVLLLDQQDTLPIIMMTGHGDVPMAVAALKAGAFEFIEKPFNHQQIIEIVQRALEYARQRHQAQAQVASLKARYRSLKPKEQQIMTHVARGLTNREIAEHMEVSPKTVEVYRLRAMKTMQAGNVADWVRQAVALGLVAALPP